MNFVINYTDRRSHQLNSIDRIDSVLINSPCPDIISSYLLSMRRFNKKQFDKFNSTSWWNKKSLLEEELTLLDNHLNDIESRIQNGDNPCHFLPFYINNL